MGFNPSFGCVICSKQRLPRLAKRTMVELLLSNFSSFLIMEVVCLIILMILVYVAYDRFR